MSIEQVRQTLFEGRDHIVGAPVAAAKEKWVALGIGQIGVAIDSIIAQLAGIHVQTELALDDSAAVRDQIKRGIETVMQAEDGAESPHGISVNMAASTLGTLTDVPLQVGGQLSAVYTEIAANLGNLKNLVSGAQSIQEAMVHNMNAIERGATGLGNLIEAHADSLIIFDEE